MPVWCVPGIAVNGPSSFPVLEVYIPVCVCIGEKKKKMRMNGGEAGAVLPGILRETAEMAQVSC